MRIGIWEAKVHVTATRILCAATLRPMQVQNRQWRNRCHRCVVFRPPYVKPLTRGGYGILPIEPNHLRSLATNSQVNTDDGKPHPSNASLDESALAAMIADNIDKRYRNLCRLMVTYLRGVLGDYLHGNTKTGKTKPSV